MNPHYPVLMYHAVRPATPSPLDASDPHLTDPAAQPYILSESDFLRQMQLVADSRAGSRLTWESLTHPDPSRAAIVTFDDGHRTNAEVALPILNSLHLAAIFFITTDWIGKPGYMSAGQLRELASSGMLIGAHGRTHRYLSDLSDAEIDGELRGSRARLEDLLGVPVPGMSLPGGRLSARVRERIGAAGYRFLFTSRIGLASPVDDPLDLPRVPITNWLADGFLERLLSGDDRDVRSMARDARLRDFAKTILGNKFYDRLRLAILRRNA